MKVVDKGLVSTVFLTVLAVGVFADWAPNFKSGM